MKRQHAPALAIGAGVAVGLRPMTTLAAEARLDSAGTFALRKGSFR